MAVAVGFVLMQAAILAATIVATRALAPSVYLWANVGYSTLFALAGGYLAATVARHRGVLHGSLLAILIVALGLLSVDNKGNHPRWYPAVLTFASAGAAVLGGYICSRLRRRLSAGHYRGSRT